MIYVTCMRQSMQIDCVYNVLSKISRKLVFISLFHFRHMYVHLCMVTIIIFIHIRSTCHYIGKRSIVIEFEK